MQIKNLSTYSKCGRPFHEVFVLICFFSHLVKTLMIGVFNANNVIKNKNGLVRIKLDEILFNRIVILHLHLFQ